MHSGELLSASDAANTAQQQRRDASSNAVDGFTEWFKGERQLNEGNISLRSAQVCRCMQTRCGHHAAPIPDCRMSACTSAVLITT